MSNFFSQLAALSLTGDLNLTISGTADQMVVAVRLSADKCGDKAAGLQKPLTLLATADELDEKFFATISQPIQKTDALHTNMESYLKTQEIVKRESAEAKAKETKEKEAKVAATKAVDEAIKKVEELITGGRYHEALARLPKAEQFSGHEKRINDKGEEIRRKLGIGVQPDLFALCPTPTPPTTSPAPDAVETGSEYQTNSQDEDENGEGFNADEYEPQLETTPA